MTRKNIKIIIAILGSLFITLFLTNTVFLFNSPKANRFFFLSLFKKITSKPTPTLRPVALIKPSVSPTPQRSIAPTIILPTKKMIPIPSKTPTPKPTLKLIMPTVVPTLRPVNCPTTSSQGYNSIRAERSNDDLIFGDPATSPEINLRLRGFGPVNEGTNFISRNGSTYGLDDQMPPQISSLFGGPVPQIIKTYVVYEWDFDNGKSNAPNPATPNYKVHVLGLSASPGQKLVGLKAGRQIDPAGDVFMVLYATQNDIVFTHSNSDTLMGGYLFYLLDICVDSNLLKAYQQANSGGRN